MTKSPVSDQLMFMTLSPAGTPQWFALRVIGRHGSTSFYIKNAKKENYK